MNSDEILKITEQTVRSISHEVKNPLTTIKGYVQLIEKKKDNPEFVNKALGIIEEQILTIDHHFEDIYNIFNLKLNLYEDVIVNDILKEIRSNFKYKDKISIKEGSNFIVKSDSSVIYKMLSYLIEDLYWEIGDNISIKIEISEKKCKLSYKGLDFTILNDKILSIPFSSKQLFISGLELFYAQKVCIESGIDFYIDMGCSNIVLGK